MEKLESKKRQKAEKAFWNYYEQGELRKNDHQTYLMEIFQIDISLFVHQQQQSQKQFLDSILNQVQVNPVLLIWVLIDLRLQEYGDKYQTVGTVMELFANYLL